MNDPNIVYGTKPTVAAFEGTAGQQVHQALLKYQDLPEAVICAQTKAVLSYKKILETSCRLAHALQLHGYSHNNVAAVFCENCLEYLYPVLASWYIGMIVAPINYEYIKHELQHVINLSKPELIFCSLKTLPKVRKLQTQVDYIKQVIVMDLDGHIEGVQSLESFMSCKSSVQKFQPVEKHCADQVALIMCSSGTTGLPKGVMVTHSNLVNRFAHIMEPEFMFAAKPTSYHLSFAPKFHIVGLCTSIEALLMGQRTILLKKFEPRLFLQCIQEYKIKVLRLSSPVAVFIAKSPLCSQYNLSSVEDILIGTAPLAKDIEETLQKRFGNNASVRQGYGLTESFMGVIYNPKRKCKLSSVGKVLPRMAVKVVDVENGNSLEANKPGEIWIKGPLVTKGYVGDDIATATTFLAHGWLRTGDVGYYDEDGYFYIIDRLKELIKYKGFQVAPAELEAILLGHPKISDAGVVGVPDERAGELPAAFVCVHEGQHLTERQVLEFVSSQVSSQKQLRGGVYFVDEIPKNLNGKILRRELRKLIRHKVSKL